MNRLDGKVAIVTGASRGIGQAIALAFAREGASVVVTGRSTAAHESVADEVRAFGCDALTVTADSRKGGPRQTAYKATKVALINLTESVAAEVKHHWIDANCICRGGVDTEGPRNALGPNVTAEFPTMPARAMANIALFHVSDASSSITGTSIDAFDWSNPIFMPPVRIESIVATT